MDERSEEQHARPESDGPRTGPLPAGGSLRARLATLRGDRLALAGAFVFAAITLPYLLPLLSQERLVSFSEGLFFVPLLALVAISMFAGLDRIRSPEARRFWAMLGIGYSCWLGSQLITVQTAWDTSLPASAIVYDALIVGYYMAAILATTQAPHETAGLRTRRRGQLLEYLGTACFALGMMVYFDVLPFLVDRASFSGRQPAMLLFLALDLSLVLRLFALWRVSTSRHWRLLYGLLLASFLLQTVGETLDALVLAGIDAYRSGTAADFLWYGLYVPAFLAGRLKASESPVDPVPAPTLGYLGSQLLTFAFLVPFVHFALSGTHVIDGPAQGLRNVTALVTMAALIALAQGQQLRLEASNRGLEADLERARRRLASAEKVEAVGRLAGGVAHDFNNQLAVILGYNELVRHQAAGDRDLDDATAAIEVAARRAAALTAQLLAVGRRQPLIARPLDLDALVAELLPALAGAPDGAVRVEQVRCREPATVRADAALLESAILHLAMNAREAMPHGGRLTLTTEILEIAAAELPPLAACPAGRYVRLEVADTGIGISAEVLAHLFEPFFTTKPAGQGNGLGLAVVHGIVEQSGGFVTVDSAAGAGTRFRIHQPAASAGPSPA